MHRLGAQGSTALEELEKLEKDEWTNKLINFWVLRDQLIQKLCSRWFELNVLDHSKAHTINQNVKAHVEKAVKSQSSGIDVTLQKYKEKLKLLRRLQLASLTHKNKYLPPSLTCDAVTLGSPRYGQGPLGWQTSGQPLGCLLSHRVHQESH